MASSYQAFGTEIPLPIEEILAIPLIWKMLHQRIRHEECGEAVTVEAKKGRARKIIRGLRSLVPRRFRLRQRRVALRGVRVGLPQGQPPESIPEPHLTGTRCA